MINQDFSQNNTINTSNIQIQTAANISKERAVKMKLEFSSKQDTLNKEKL